MARTAIREKATSATTSTSTLNRGRVSAPRSGQFTDEQIRERAYRIYLARSAGGRDGDAISDWNQAKEELQREGVRTR